MKVREGDGGVVVYAGTDEKNLGYIEDAEKIIVHGGYYHADDVLACAMLKALNPGMEIVRTRNPEIIDEGLRDPKTIVLDVGKGAFDHHQDDTKAGVMGPKACAASLVYMELVTGGVLCDRLETLKHQIGVVEYIDNGMVPPEEINDPMHRKFADNIHATVPTWESPKSLDEAFFEQVDKYAKMIDRMYSPELHDKEDSVIIGRMLEEVDKITTETNELSVSNLQSLERGREAAKEAYEKADDKRIIMLPHPGIDWQHVLCETEAQFVIFKTSDGQIGLQAVPPTETSFEQKCPIPVGMLDEYMDNPEYYPKNTRQPFVHKERFFAALPVNEHVSEAMAVELLRGHALGLIHSHEQASDVREQEKETAREV